jgi:hypothetical protein
MIEFATVNAIIEEAGIDPASVSKFEVDATGVIFTIFVRVPAEEEDKRHRMLHDGEFMFIKKFVPLHRPGDHVHEEDVILDHTHD